MGSMVDSLIGSASQKRVYSKSQKRDRSKSQKRDRSKSQFWEYYRFRNHPNIGYIVHAKCQAKITLNMTQVIHLKSP